MVCSPYFSREGRLNLGGYDIDQDFRWEGRNISDFKIILKVFFFPYSIHQSSIKQALITIIQFSQFDSITSSLIFHSVLSIFTIIMWVLDLSRNPIFLSFLNSLVCINFNFSHIYSWVIDSLICMFSTLSRLPLIILLDELSIPLMLFYSIVGIQNINTIRNHCLWKITRTMNKQFIV